MPSQSPQETLPAPVLPPGELYVDTHGQFIYWSSTPESSQPFASQPPAKQEPYHFDFGKHKGQTIAEVPPDYMSFLQQKGIIDDRPDLVEGVAECERHNPPIGAPSTGCAAKKAPYRFTFE
ncbi:hypothetical protein G6011_02851 [Alternaria panax]|uniref:Uncharacterized protein n=1 Tax=Alternaria panax TaxID=48097 RepID=A0AAD4FAE8_9PLEO|nr:hypothetical protein G6011_02851 [Alternaria panax]